MKSKNLSQSNECCVVHLGCLGKHMDGFVQNRCKFREARFSAIEDFIWRFTVHEQ